MTRVAEGKGAPMGFTGGIGRAVCIGVAVIAGACVAASAMAQCAVQPEDGVWVNLDPNTRGITHVDLRFTCQDQVVNGQPFPPGPPWHIHVFGKCHPLDCDWGTTGAQRASNGFITGSFNQGFATRLVRARISPQQQDTLQVLVHTDFRDPNRRDYDLNELFRRQQ